jgi:tetratricopeptide (TPR) repeat protein
MYKTIHYFLVFKALLILFQFQVIAQEIHEKEQKLALLSNDTSKANLLIDLGRYYCSRNFEKSLLYLQHALLLSTEIDYREGVAGSLLWQGRAYYYKDEYELAMEYLAKAKSLFSALEQNKGLAECYFASGAIHHILGNHLEAIKDFQELVRMSQLSQNIDLEATGFMSLGTLHLERKEADLALQYLNKALRLKEQINKTLDAATITTNIGRVYELLEKHELALEHYENGLKTRKMQGEKRGIASSQLIIGNLMHKTGNYQSATEHLQSSHKLFTELKDDTGICLSLLNWAQAANATGEILQANTKLHEALRLAKNINNPKLISEVYAAFVAVMAHNKNFESAFQYKALESNIRDSLASANRERLIRELEVKFQTARKDDEIRFLKNRAEIQAKNNVLLTVSIIALAVIVILLILLFQLKTISLRRQQKLADQEHTIHKQQTEIRQREQELLEKQLEAKNRELASKALEMLRMNETISNIIEQLNHFGKENAVNENHIKHINEIIGGLETKLRDNSWNEFEKIFKNIHTGFFRKLLDVCPDLTPAEIKIAAFLRLNLTTKEIAAVSFKSESGVKSARFRLRKKLALQSDDSLIPFLMKL